MQRGLPGCHCVWLRYAVDILVRGDNGVCCLYDYMIATYMLCYMIRCYMLLLSRQARFASRLLQTLGEERDSMWDDIQSFELVRMLTQRRRSSRLKAIRCHNAAFRGRY